MGYSGNVEPQYIVPTACARQEVFGAKQTQQGLSDLDFYIGNEAMSRASTHTVDCTQQVFTRIFTTQKSLSRFFYLIDTTDPIRHGLIENWDDMERLWQRCFFDYLRCEPEVRKESS